MKKVIRDNGLGITLFIAFFLSLVGMIAAGWRVENADLAEHGKPAIGLLAYLGGAEFVSAVFENWESEFLQMSSYVVLTAFLFQRGSAESKNPDEPSPEDGDPAAAIVEASPWPVKAGSLVRSLYAYSLGIALAALFVLSFTLHWLASVRVANAQAVLHGSPVQTAFQYLGSSRLWFESFQNWQSEFLSTGVLVVLSVFLRYRGSPESKPVAAPNAAAG